MSENTQEIPQEEPVQQEAAVVQKEETQYTDIEQNAMELGWKPKDQFNDSEKEFIGAEEYLRRGPLIKEIMSRNRELKEMKDTLKKLSDHVSKNEQAAYARGFKDK